MWTSLTKQVIIRPTTRLGALQGVKRK
uniref:Uncharacterized protein n=1 Tax=Rhizophora mucronata TaxID=61149 RepID=A0A2P2NFN0_RHIMU